jgi:hypothetical protein
MQDLRLLGQPVLISLKDGLSVGLIIMRCQRRLILPLLVEMQGSIPYILTESKLYAARFGAGLLDDLADGCARRIEVLRAGPDLCDDVQLVRHNDPLVSMITILAIREPVKRLRSSKADFLLPTQFTLFPVAIHDTKSGWEGSAQMAPEAAFLVPTQLRTEHVLPYDAAIR